MNNKNDKKQIYIIKNKHHLSNFYQSYNKFKKMSILFFKFMIKFLMYYKKVKNSN